MDGFKIGWYYFPSFSENKLNIYCIYIKNYTLIAWRWCLCYWGAPKVRSLRINSSVLLLPPENVFKCFRTTKLIQKRIHNPRYMRDILYPPPLLCPCVHYSWSCRPVHRLLWWHVRPCLAGKQRRSLMACFINTTIKKSQSFYCEFDLKIEQTPGGRAKEACPLSAHAEMNDQCHADD